MLQGAAFDESQTGEALDDVRSTTPGEVCDLVALARKVQPEWGAMGPRAGRGI